jgi:hypothetical protein
MRFSQSHRRTPLVVLSLAAWAQGAILPRVVFPAEPVPASGSAGVAAKDPIQVLDLRAIPKLGPANVFGDSATDMGYTSRSNVPAVIKHYASELAARGWKDQKIIEGLRENDRYADRFFGKDGFVLRLVVSADNDGAVTVFLSNLGDVPMSSLPPPQGAKAVGKPSHLIASYTVTADMASVGAQCRRELAAHRYREFESFDDRGPALSDRVSFDVFRGTTVVNVLVVKGNGPYAGKMLLSYVACQALAAELPIVEDATAVKLDREGGRIEYRSNQVNSALIAFYRAAYLARGYTDTTRKDAGEGVLFMTSKSGDRMLVTVGDPKDGRQRVTVEPAPREVMIASKPAAPAQTPQIDMKTPAFGVNPAIAKAEAQPVPARAPGLTESPDPVTDPEGFKRYVKAAVEADFDRSVRAIESKVKAELDDNASPSGAPARREPAGLPAARTPLAAPDADAPPKGKTIAAEKVKEVSGMPLPPGNHGQSVESTEYRQSVETRVASNLDAVAAFYHKELSERRWRETSTSQAADKNSIVMAFASSDGTLSATLVRDGKDVKVSLVTRHPDAAQRDGLVPPEGRARLLVANGLAGDVTVTINGSPFVVPQGAGKNGPISGFKVDLFPGNNQLVIRRPGQSDETRQIPAAAGDAWGLLLIPSGELMTMQLY